jgi:ribonuclease T1
MSMPRRRLGLRSLVPFILVCALAATGLAPAAGHASVTALDTGTVCRSTLPAQAGDTLRLISQGGPFPYPQDGQLFQNRERVLPSEPSGYYHEYTVKTPGSPTRGARRIVTARSGTDYYTADHYVTFDAIDFGC